jgi:hypothetical protein
MSGSFPINMSFSDLVVLAKKKLNDPHLFCIFVIISPLKRASWLFIWTILNYFYARMICTKFDKNWLAVFVE